MGFSGSACFSEFGGLYKVRTLVIWFLSNTVDQNSMKTPVMSAGNELKTDLTELILYICRIVQTSIAAVTKSIKVPAVAGHTPYRRS